MGDGHGVEQATERGQRVLKLLVEAGKRVGLHVQTEYPVVGGRIDLVWLWQGPEAFPSVLPLVGFEIESSWRTRKHLKGDFLNLLDLQPALGVIVLLGEGAEVDSTRRFAKEMIERRSGRMEIWSEADVLALSDQGVSEERIRELLPDAGLGREEDGATEVRHSGKYHRLAAWLARQKVDRVDVTFAEIEEVLGFPLPPSSRKHPPHWHGYDGSAVARAISDAGWKARNVDITGEHVTFERKVGRAGE